MLFQGYPVHELSSFVFFIFPMCILMLLYIRMGLQIRQTSEIQRNLPAARNYSPPPPQPPRPLLLPAAPMIENNGLATNDLHTCASCKEVFVPLESVQAKTRPALFACWGSREGGATSVPIQPKPSSTQATRDKAEGAVNFLQYFREY